jgi:hypothetical protein
MVANIFIATIILWVISALFVVPLANYFVARKLQEPAFAHLSGDELDASQAEELKRLATKYYILADVFVLGIAGVIGGLLGYRFIGISLEARGWPGIVAFIAASFVGSSFA